MKKRGFTLIELLVVIAIIGILSGVVLASLNTARVKARNAQRISDARQVQLALEFFFDDQATGAYPTQAAAADWLAAQAWLNVTYLPQVPIEPVAGRQVYRYMSANNATTYCFGVSLEGATGAINAPDNNRPACITSLGGTLNTTNVINYAVGP